MNSAKWRPLLTGASARKAWRYIEALEKETDAYEKKFHDVLKGPNWIGNALGAGLFCHYLAQVSGEKKYQQRADSFLSQATDDLGRIYSHDRLYSGFAGIGWLAEHMHG